MITRSSIQRNAGNTVVEAAVTAVTAADAATQTSSIASSVDGASAVMREVHA